MRYVRDTLVAMEFRKAKNKGINKDIPKKMEPTK